MPPTVTAAPLGASPALPLTWDAYALHCSISAGGIWCRSSVPTFTFACRETFGLSGIFVRATTYEVPNAVVPAITIPSVAAFQGLIPPIVVVSFAGLTRRSDRTISYPERQQNRCLVRPMGSV